MVSPLYHHFTTSIHPLSFNIIRMRRTAYNDKYQRNNYIKASSRQKEADLATKNLKLDLSRLPEDNFLVPRTPYQYYQSKLIKPTAHRPLTTQKPGSFLQYRRQSHDAFNISKNQQKQQLLINTFKDSFKDIHRGQGQIDSSKGRIYRGGSWRYEDKMGKELSHPATARYSPNRKRESQLSNRESPLDFSDNDIKGRKPSALMDLIGQNLKKAEKTSNKDDDFFEYVMRFSYRTKKGYIPSNSGKVNQDNFIISPNINSKTWQHFFSVCDGHGPLGHQVSGFIKNTLPHCVSNLKMMQRHPKEGLAKAFEMAYEKLRRESKIDLNFSGSTVISCYLQQNKLYCANVGDSRAVLGKFNSNNWEAIPLSNDHKPSVQKQAERIRKMKGRIQPFMDQYGDPIGPLRVWVQNDNVPGLAMTRSFGDLVAASVGVSPLPEIKQFALSQQDKIILIGSDGVFEFLSNEELITAVAPFYEGKQIQQASDHLMTLANRSWTKNSSIIDDITFILIFISYNEM